MKIKTLDRGSKEPPSNINVKSIDENQIAALISITGEYPLTLYVNKVPLVTLMTMGQHPEALSVGYLVNQGLISSIDDISSITVDWETNSSIIVLSNKTNLEEQRLAERTITSGCGQGTMLGNLLDKTDEIELPETTHISKGTLYKILHDIRQRETVYKTSGAVHGCALLEAEKIIYFIEDVGRHNAVDAIAGKMMMENIKGQNKYFYTTGRLTSEMVIKCAQMRIPILISRSGVTHMGWKIAKDINLTMIGRAKGKHFLLFSGESRFLFDEAEYAEN